MSLRVVYLKMYLRNLADSRVVCPTRSMSRDLLESFLLLVGIIIRLFILFLIHSYTRDKFLINDKKEYIHIYFSKKQI